LDPPEVNPGALFVPTATQDGLNDTVDLFIDTDAPTKLLMVAVSDQPKAP
jgi:hypothetical protein